jgi:prepilin-type N-terminal cleavage/methylation domain-containing protein
VAIRPPNHNSQGYTLVEMLVVLMVTGFVMSIAVPSLLALSKPLRDGTLQFKSQLSLIRAKAIATNQAYRIRPKYPTAALVLAAHRDPVTLQPSRAYPQSANNFIVEYAANCQVSTYGAGLPVNPANPTYPNGTPNGWQAASQLDLDLPGSIGVVTAQVAGNAPPTTQSYPLANNPGAAGAVVAFDSSLGWSICYDNRGVAFQTVSLKLQDFQANNRAKFARIYAGVLNNSADVDTYEGVADTTLIPLTSQGNPVF